MCRSGTCEAPRQPSSGHPKTRNLVSPLGRLARLPRVVLKAPIHAYQLILRPWIGQHCRHLPTCSDYALEAIELNGAWRGFWLTVSRLCRCRPGGTHGYDPVPDLRRVWYIAPWRYGRWLRINDRPATPGEPPTSDRNGR